MGIFRKNGEIFVSIAVYQIIKLQSCVSVPICSPERLIFCLNKVDISSHFWRKWIPFIMTSFVKEHWSCFQILVG